MHPESLEMAAVGEEFWESDASFPAGGRSSWSVILHYCHDLQLLDDEDADAAEGDTAAAGEDTAHCTSGWALRHPTLLTTPAVGAVDGVIS